MIIGFTADSIFRKVKAYSYMLNLEVSYVNVRVAKSLSSRLAINMVIKYSNLYQDRTPKTWPNEHTRC